MILSFHFAIKFIEFDCRNLSYPNHFNVPNMATISPFSIVTFFIGGAADKNRFWYVGPKTNLIRATLINLYLKAVSTSSLAAMEANQKFESAYFGYDEMDELFDAIQVLIKRHPNIKIRLLGHSLGGWQAAKMSSRLAIAGIKTDLLVTLDPVGIGYFMNFPGNETSLPRPKAQTWINIAATHTIEYDVNDAVADAGIRWRPSRDSELKHKPTFDIGTPYSHADVWKMVTFPGAASKSAWEILTQIAP